MEVHEKKKYLQMPFKNKHLANIHLWSVGDGLRAAARCVGGREANLLEGVG